MVPSFSLCFSVHKILIVTSSQGSSLLAFKKMFAFFIFLWCLILKGNKKKNPETTDSCRALIWLREVCVAHGSGNYPCCCILTKPFLTRRGWDQNSVCNEFQLPHWGEAARTDNWFPSGAGSAINKYSCSLAYLYFYLCCMPWKVSQIPEYTAPFPSAQVHTGMVNAPFHRCLK